MNRAMIQLKKTITIILIVAILNSSCVVSNQNRVPVAITMLDEVDCQVKADAVPLFFQGENLDFNYQKIALIEVEGEKEHLDIELLNWLKYHAWSNCANGIINVEKVHLKVAGSASTGFDEEESLYGDKKIYQGIAVNIQKDSTFVKKYGDSTDLSFVEVIALEQNNETNNRKVARTLGSIFFTGLIILGVYLKFTQPEEDN